MNIKKQLIEGLKEVLENFESSEIKFKGICFVVECLDEDFREVCIDYLKSCFEVWDKFSGDRSYPILCPNWGVDPEEQYDMVFVECTSNNEYIKQYIDLRKELLEFCINRLEGLL